jgi:hypothetical protein
MKKIVIMLICIAVWQNAFASYQFSAVAPSGQLLFYKISGGNAIVTYPGSAPTSPNSAPYSGVYSDYEPTGNLVIPSTVTNGATYDVTGIDDYAFWRCAGLTSVSIPNSVTNIGESVFGGCTGLIAITIPSSVTSIGYHAFQGCSSLASVAFNAVDCTSIGARIFQNCQNLTNFTFGDNVTSIPWGLCYGVSSLVSVSIGNSVTSIGNEAFYDCSSLSSVIIPDGVTSIGESAFHGCTGMTDVYCQPNPDNLTWTGASTSFKNNQATKCHVMPQYLSSYQTNFSDVRVTFVGDAYFLDIVADSWQAIATPTHDDGQDFLSASNVANFIPSADEFAYDFFYYDEDDATWRNYKQNAFNLQVGNGHIYRRSADAMLVFTGTPNSENVVISLSATDASGNLKGFNLVGNPYPHTLAFSRPYYELNADGTWQAFPNGGTLAIGQAVLIHTDTDGEALTLSPEGIVSGNAKGYLPPLPKGLCIGGHTPEPTPMSVESENFALWDGGSWVITGNGTLEAFDVMGRKLFSHVVNSQLTISNSHFPRTGVYVLRLNGQSQKIVIEK